MKERLAREARKSQEDATVEVTIWSDKVAAIDEGDEVHDNRHHETVSQGMGAIPSGGGVVQPISEQAGASRPHA